MDEVKMNLQGEKAGMKRKTEMAKGGMLNGMSSV